MDSSHIGLTFEPSEAIIIGMMKTTNEAPMKNIAMENFTVVLGSRSRRASRSHSHAMTGARAMTHSGFTDWNHEDGKSSPKTWPFVFLSAKTDIVEPAWSKIIQKSAAATKNQM